MLQRLHSGPTTASQLDVDSVFAKLASSTNRRQQWRRASRRPHRSSRRHFNDCGERRAVLRALAGARMYLTGVVPTLAMAAESCGSTVAYITSAITVLKTEDPALMTAVLDGRVKLYAAAQAMKPLANLLSAYRNTDSSDRFAFTQAVGTAEVWDRLIMPALESDTNAGRKEVPTQI